MTYIRHEPGCQLKHLPRHSDAARRMCDQWTLHRLAVGPVEACGKWYAVQLDDGSSDGVLYDTKQDAIRHQRKFEFYYAFVCLSLAQMNVCDAEIYLGIQRRMYKAGIRMTDPDARRGGMDVIKRAAREDMTPTLHSLQGTNIIIPGKG